MNRFSYRVVNRFRRREGDDVFDLMIGIDGVQRRTRQSLDRPAESAAKRRISTLRAAAAEALRTLANRLEPVGTPATNDGAEPVSS